MTGEAADNPYPGLFYFTPENSHLFFGREGQSDALVARLARSRFLAVVGTSGSGKSSLVRAGLLPSLWGGYLRQAGSEWLVADLRPGSDPFGRLAAELAGTAHFGDEAAIRSRLRESSLSLVELVRSADLADNNLLILVDQFEELFRFSSRKNGGSGDHGEAAAFVKLILEATSAPNLPIYVVITMRSDFLGDCAAFRNLPEAISDGQYLVPRLTREQQRLAIEGPARLAGGAITNRLVQRLLNDTARDQDQDQLPLLQHALMRIWDVWCHDDACEAMDLVHYELIGTIANALSKHADEAYAEASRRVDRGDALIKAIFQRLGGRDEEGRETRCESSLQELSAITGAPVADLRSCLDAFRRPRRAFVMPPSDRPLEPSTDIDITHECLLRKWQILRDKWIPEETDAARTYRKLVYAAEDGTPMTGRALTNTLEWWKKSHPNLAWAERYPGDFEKAERFKRKSERFRIWKNVLGAVLAVVAISYVVWTTMQRLDQRQASAVQQALAEARNDNAMTLVMARTAGSLINDPALATTGALLAAAAYRRPGCPATDEARDVLIKAQSALPAADRKLALSFEAQTLAFADGGNLLAAGASEGEISLWRTQDSREVGHLRVEGSPRALEMDGGGNRLVAVTEAGTHVIRLEPRGDRVEAAPEFDFPCEVTQWASLSLDGDKLAVSCSQSLRYFSRGEKGWKEEPKRKKAGYGWLLSRDGTAISGITPGSGSNGSEYRVWRDLSLRAHHSEIPDLEQWDVARGELLDIAWLSGGNTVDVARASVIGGRNEGSAPLRLTAAGDIHTLLLTDEGDRLIVATLDGLVQIWSLPEGVEVLRRRHPGVVNGAAFDSKKGQLALATEKEVLLIQLGLAQASVLRSPRLVSAGVLSANAPNGLVAMRFEGTSVATILLPIGSCVSPWSYFNYALDSGATHAAHVGCSDKGPTLDVVALGTDGRAGDRKVATLGVVGLSRLNRLMVSDGGRWLATISRAKEAVVTVDGTKWPTQLRVVDMDHPDVQLEKPMPGEARFSALAPSGASVWILVRDESLSRIERFDVQTQTWSKVLTASVGNPTAFALSTDERLFALASTSSPAVVEGAAVAPVATTPLLQIWGADGQLRTTLSSTEGRNAIGETTAIAFNAAGTHLATADGATVRIWDLARNTQVARVVLGAPVSQVAFSLDGRGVSVVSGDRLGSFLWDGAQLIDAVCRSAGRDLTPEEWSTYVPPDVPRRAVCSTGSPERVNVPR